MSCQDVRALFDAYLDNELDLLTATQFESHLRDCAACHAFIQQYKDRHRVVKAHIPYFDAPQRLEQHIRAELRIAERSADQGTQRRLFSNWQRWAVPAALAAVLALSAILVVTLRRPSSSEILADQVVACHIRSLMAGHISDVASSDQHTVKPWFNGKLDFAPTVLDLSSSGFPLQGGRLDYLDNRTVAALVYKCRQHTINLFIWPSGRSDSAPQRLTIKGYNIVHWNQSHMTYWAISDLNMKELNEFVDDQRK